jgi:hypothetical protein
VFVHDTKFIIYFIYETFNDNSAFFKFESKTLFSILQFYKDIILFYLFRVGRAFGTTKMFNYENRQMA